jgi:hypothetical protein
MVDLDSLFQKTPIITPYIRPVFRQPEDSFEDIALTVEFKI